MHIYSFKFVKFLFVLVVCFYSCGSNKDDFERTEDGLGFRFINSTNGQKPSLGDIMIMHISYRTEYDSVLYDSKLKSDSFTVVLVEPTFKGGVEEGFAMMSTGDSAIFKVSADSLFEKTFQTTIPAYIKPGSSITFQVRLEKIIPKAVHDSLEHVHDVEMRKVEF